MAGQDLSVPVDKRGRSLFRRPGWVNGGGRGGAWHDMAVMEGVRAVLCIRPRARFKLPSIAASRTYYVPVCLSVPFGAVRERGRLLPNGNRSLPSLCFSSSICFLPFLPSHLHLLNSYPSCQCLSHHHHHHHHISPDPARVTYHHGTTGHDILSFGVPCAPSQPQILLCRTPVHPSASAPPPPPRDRGSGHSRPHPLPDYSRPMPEPLF
ncbi:hypothetical protein LY76DRAFT_86457 [Colletotrichum caudatum]|nr:hypothetical protein LY76DRAFT_86457 [Colletotrichum caudatum]